MAESTLSVDYMRLVRELALQLGKAKTYSASTITTSGSSTTITLASGTFPTWAGTTSTGTSAINIAGTLYAVTTRTDATNLVIDTAVNLASATNYVLMQSQDDSPTDAFQVVEDCIAEGYSELCKPATDNEHKPEYCWSWLLERATLSLTASDYDYDLPDNFDQYLDDSLSFSAGSGYDAPNVTTAADIRRLKAQDDATGLPQFMAWRPKSTFDASTGRRFEAVFYPTPDASYTIEYLYRFIPDKLTPTNRYPACGAAHSDTLLKLCQAAAERKIDDEASIYQAKAQERLAASLASDKRIRAAMGV